MSRATPVQSSSAVDSRAVVPASVKTAGLYLSLREGWTNPETAWLQSAIKVCATYDGHKVCMTIDLHFSYDPVEEEYVPAMTSVVFVDGKHVDVLDQWPATDYAALVERSAERIERVVNSQKAWSDDTSTCHEGHDKEQP